MTKEVEKLKIQIQAEVIEEEAEQLAVAEQERTVKSFQKFCSGKVHLPKRAIGQY
jgi:putative transposon-encoded protein